MEQTNFDAALRSDLVARARPRNRTEIDLKKNITRAPRQVAERMHEIAGAPRLNNAMQRQPLSLPQLTDKAQPSEPPPGADALPFTPPVERVASPSAQAARKPGKKCGQPEIYTEDELAKVLSLIDRRFRSPRRESFKATLLLTCRAGFRPCEASGIRTRTLFSASGELLNHVLVMPGTAKCGKERRIPMHDQLRAALLDLHRVCPEAQRVAFTIGKDGVLHHQSAAAVALMLKNIYVDAGLYGCSGMSGRHKFANDLYRSGVLEADIQKLMGHSSLKITSIYLRRQDVLFDIVNKIGHAEHDNT